MHFLVGIWISANMDKCAGIECPYAQSPSEYKVQLPERVRVTSMEIGVGMVHRAQAIIRILGMLHLLYHYLFHDCTEHMLRPC